MGGSQPSVPKNSKMYDSHASGVLSYPQKVSIAQCSDFPWSHIDASPNSRRKLSWVHRSTSPSRMFVSTTGCRCSGVQLSHLWANDVVVNELASTRSITVTNILCSGGRVIDGTMHGLHRHPKAVWHRARARRRPVTTEYMRQSLTTVCCVE